MYKIVLLNYLKFDMSLYISILISLLTGTACSDFSLCTNYSSQGCNKASDKSKGRGVIWARWLRANPLMMARNDDRSVRQLVTLNPKLGSRERWTPAASQLSPFNLVQVPSM